MKIEREFEEELFENLWRLISDLHGIAKKYPALYRLYLRVATQERIQKAKGSESICYWCKKNGKYKLFEEDPEINQNVGAYPIMSAMTRQKSKFDL